MMPVRIMSQQCMVVCVTVVDVCVEEYYSTQLVIMTVMGCHMHQRPCPGRNRVLILFKCAIMRTICSRAHHE